MSLEKTIKEFVHDFPTEIPGAGKVDKYYVDGSRRCLVHIGDVHGEVNQIESARVRVVEIQKEVYLQLQYLINEYNINSIGVESISIEDEGLFIKELQNPMWNLLDNLLGSGYFDQLLYSKGVPLVLNSLSIVSCHGVNSKKSFLKASKAKDCPTRFYDLIFTKREDEVLDTLVSLENISYLVYGSGHNFEDVVDRWNKKHDENKYSVITLRPNSYPNGPNLVSKQNVFNYGSLFEKLFFPGYFGFLNLVDYAVEMPSIDMAVGIILKTGFVASLAAFFKSDSFSTYLKSEIKYFREIKNLE